jgi:ABC-type Mn2+/Zn2+ transport system ATPase subunit
MIVMLIELKNIVLGYSNRPVVRVEHLAVRPGRCLGIFGPNGSGKTTLLRAVAGLLKPIFGTIDRSPSLRLAYLPQLRTIDASWPMSAFDAAAIASSSLSLLGWVGRRKHAIHQQLQTLGVDELARRPFRTLSGGQQQRILLAGVLATDPQVLLLDEPTDGLDLRSRDLLVDTLHRAREAGLAIVLITHDPGELSLLADEIAHLHLAPDAGQPSWIDVVTDAARWTPATNPDRTARS